MLKIKLKRLTTLLFVFMFVKNHIFPFCPRNGVFDDLEVKSILKMTLKHQNNIIF